MRLVGCLLLLSGFALVLAALAMLPGFAQRLAFVCAGLAVEVLGLALLTQGYRSLQIEGHSVDAHAAGAHAREQR